MEGYAVSGQCMALVRDNCLVPTKDAPELGYIRESSDKCYVPDVYYKVSKLNLVFLSTVSLTIGRNFICLFYKKKTRTLFEYVFISIVVLSKLFHVSHRIQ